MLCSTSTTKVTKQLPQVNYIVLFFHEWTKNGHEWTKNGHSRFGNWYQVDIQRAKNKIKRRWVSYFLGRKNQEKNKNRA